MPQQDAVDALAGITPVGPERAPGPGRVAHATAGAGAVLRRRAQIAAAVAARQSAMNCEVYIAPKTEPRGSPRKISIEKRRIAYPKR